MNPFDYAKHARGIQRLMATASKEDLDVKVVKIELKDGRVIIVDNLVEFPLSCTFMKKEDAKYCAFYINGGEIDWPDKLENK